MNVYKPISERPMSECSTGGCGCASKPPAEVHDPEVEAAKYLAIEVDINILEAEQMNVLEQLHVVTLKLAHARGRRKH